MVCPLKATATRFNKNNSWPFHLLYVVFPFNFVFKFLSFLLHRLSPSPSCQWPEPMWRSCGDTAQWHVGHCVRWWLGHEGCQCGVSADWVRPGAHSLWEHSVWARHRSHLLGQRGLQGQRIRAERLRKSGMGSPQLLPLRGCGCDMQWWTACLNSCTGTSGNEMLSLWKSLE